MKYKLQKEPDAVLQLVIDSVTRARNLVPNVEWSAEDGTRTEMDFLCAASKPHQGRREHDQHPGYRGLYHAG